MKKKQFFAVAVGAILAVSSFALSACGSGSTDASGRKGDAVAARLCYDNLDDGIDIPAEYTELKIENVEKVEELDASGKALAEGSVATYENGVLKAKGTGYAVLTVKGKKFRVEVQPAYAADPQNAYTIGNNTPDVGRDSSELLGSTHDPSLIEVMEEDGTPTYYIFSTGWSDYANGYGNDIRKSKDLIHWDFVGKPFSVNAIDDMMNGDVGNWLYAGKLAESYTWFPSVNYRPTQNSSSFKYWASWWAPDIVPAADGGYWLYTCVVDGTPEATNGGTGVPVTSTNSFDTGNYTRACILLCHSDSLEPESFEYVSVLMQSSIPFSGAGLDVNAIDPQIIYTEDGRMYMAYGSFGTGDYILELDPNTGLRKDGKNSWITHEQVRSYVSEVSKMFDGSANEEADGFSIGWTHPYYGKNISKNNMEAPVITRHDDVKVFDENASFDENGNVKDVEGKTYYYSMHSYNGLAAAYQMWGGRSEKVDGLFRSVNGGVVYNMADGNNANQGNKYMGNFSWAGKTANAIDIILPGHNDLFTTMAGTNVAAYITRTNSFRRDQNNQPITDFVSQIHQYYLNSTGDICINPNRYGGEIDRAVSKEELFKYTEKDASGNIKFKMVALANSKMEGDAGTSVDVALSEDGKIYYGTTVIGNWLMYGKGYIKITFTDVNTCTMVKNANQTLYYGVVRPAWLDDQNKSGFTITCLGHTLSTKSYAMFMNNYSTL